MREPRKGQGAQSRPRSPNDMHPDYRDPRTKLRRNYSLRTLMAYEDVWELLDQMAAEGITHFSPGQVWRRGQSSYSAVTVVLRQALDAGILVRVERGLYRVSSSNQNS